MSFTYDDFEFTLRVTDHVTTIQCMDCSTLSVYTANIDPRETSWIGSSGSLEKVLLDGASGERKECTLSMYRNAENDTIKLTLEVVSYMLNERLEILLSRATEQSATQVLGAKIGRLNEKIDETLEEMEGSMDKYRQLALIQLIMTIVCLLAATYASLE